jgi:hypothetical protein
MTWQLIISHLLEQRQAVVDTGVHEHELVPMALANLRKFGVVGLQSDIPELVSLGSRKRYG